MPKPPSRGVPRRGATTRRDDLVVGPRASRAEATASALARAVLDHGPVARSTVARATGLSTATVSVVGAQLIDAGILREVPEAAGPPGIGRPHVPLDVDTERLAVVGVHLAVPRFTVALLDLRGRVLTQHQEPYDAGAIGPDAALSRVTAGVDRLLADTTERDVLGVGLAAGGWVDPVTGVLVEHSVLGWRDVPLSEPLSAATGLPVGVDGHGRALVRAERLFGSSAERARRSVVNLFVGNVVDVAFAIGDTVHHGPRSAGGAVAHLAVEGCQDPCACGRLGCLQAAVSERTLCRRAVADGLLARPDFHDLVDLAVAGEPRALALFHERARLVGRAAAMLLDLFNPEVLTVVEAASIRIPEVLATLHGEVAARSVVVADRDPAECVRITSFPGRVLAIAGGAVALDRVYRAPQVGGEALSSAS